MTDRILIRNAQVLTMDDAGTAYARADILVEGAQIAAIGPDLAASGEFSRVIEAAGMLAMPGLINAHFHSPGNFRKGALDNLPLEIFMLYEVPPLSDTPEDGRTNYIRTMLGNLEMLKLGVTAVHDDAFFTPVPTPDAIDGLMQSYLDSGMRAAVALDQPNVIEYEKYPYLAELLPDDVRAEMAAAPRPDSAALLALYRHLIDHWHGAADGRVRAAVSISAPQRVTVDYFTALSELSKRLDLPFNVHMLETKLQRVLGREKWGKSLVQYVHDLGLLDERMQVMHAIWVDAADIELLAAAGCSVAHNPICNLRLGSGVMPFRQIKDAGVNICLGSDEACSDDSVNMWAVGKQAGLIHTLSEVDYRKWPTAGEILWALTRGGARSMRLEGQVGALVPGWQADLILLDLNTLAFTPLNDVTRQLVYNENGSSVRLTMVAGQVVVENGQVLTVDEEAIKAEARALLPDYQAAAAQAAAEAARLEPYYRAMYLRAAGEDVGLQRKLVD